MDPSENLAREVRSGNLEEVRKVITKYGLSHRREWSNGYTLLRDAVENGQMEVAKFLLANGCHINSKRSQTVPTKTVLHFAAVHGNLEIVKTLLEKGADVNVTDKDGNTPLHEAVKRNHVGTIVLLVEHGANVNIRNKNGETPLQVALDKGIQTAENQHKHGAHVNSVLNNTSKTGYTPLLCATDECERIVNILPDKSAYVNITDKDGNTPLHKAVRKSEVGTTVLLVEYGANVNARNKNGEMPLHVASVKGLIQNAEYLLTHGADVNSIAKGCTPLHFAAARGHANITKSLLKHGADVNCMCTMKKYVFHEGDSPLHLAVRKGHWSVARILLDCGANVDAQNKSTHTILHVAVAVANPSMVKMVLNYCPDVNNESNRSSLNLALNGSPLLYRNIVELLLQNGFNIRDEADANAVLKYCKSPIHTAALNGYVTVLEALLEHGASANSKDKNGETPLYAAAKKGNLRVIETLLKYGADIDSRDQHGKTALHIALLVGHADIVRRLLEHGASANSMDENGNTPLHAAAKKGNLQVIDTLVKYGADIDSRDQHGKTALHISSLSGHASIVRRLLDYGSDANITDKGNTTALDLAEKGKCNSIRKPHLHHLGDYSLRFQNHRVDKVLFLSDDTYDILEYHIIKLQTLNLPVSHKNLRSIKYNKTMLEFEEKCIYELITLKGTFVGNSKISFFHLLKKSVHHLAIILEDDDISSCITSNHVKGMFPLYGSIICGHMTIAKHRRKILDEINDCFFQIFPILNWDCIQNIITYLSNGDLMNVMHAFKRKPTAL